jgi:hypothetical protein
MALPCSATQLKSMQFLASRILVWIIEILPSRSVHRTVSLLEMLVIDGKYSNEDGMYTGRMYKGLLQTKDKAQEA